MSASSRRARSRSPAQPRYPACRQPPLCGVRDYAQVRADGVAISREWRTKHWAGLEIDPLGLDETDRRILHTIIEKFEGGPVGLDTIAAATSEEADAIMDVYEPYLLQLGFLASTPRGRVATRSGYEHIGIPYPIKLDETESEQPRLFEILDRKSWVAYRRSASWVHAVLHQVTCLSVGRAVAPARIAQPAGRSSSTWPEKEVGLRHGCQ